MTYHKDPWKNVKNRLLPNVVQHNSIDSDVVYHLLIKRGYTFRCRPRVVDGNYTVDLNIPNFQDFRIIERALTRWKVIKKLTILDLSGIFVNTFINFIGTTKNLQSFNYLKIQGSAIQPDVIRYIVSIAPHLASLYLPDVTIIGGMNLLDIIMKSKLIECLDLLTTVGIRIPPYIFDWLRRNHRCMRLFYIWPIVRIPRDDVYAYLPFWESFLTHTTRQNNASICIRTDSLFANLSINKLSLQEDVTYLIDVTNIFFDDQLKQLGKERATHGPNVNVRTTIRARELLKKCLFFDIPLATVFIELADAAALNDTDSETEAETETETEEVANSAANNDNK